MNYNAKWCLNKFRLALIQRIIGRWPPSCWIRTFLIIFIMTFIWAQVTLDGSKLNYRAKISSRHIPIKAAINKNFTNIIKIADANMEQVVYNEERFPPITNDSLVLLVQVHKRVTYLKYLIESLSKARYIKQVLLIFSHDVYDREINKLIQNVTFCKVMQIYFPYSLETYPDRFPGNDPGDCPRNIGRDRAKKINCLNAAYPDKYGNYRESKFTQIKHHWWWKLNHVFGRLKITATYTGLVLFLEEDHYVTEDFIHVLKLMRDKCRVTTDCHFMGLGLHQDLKAWNRFGKFNEVKMSPLNTNLGLAFDRETFRNAILNCAEEFCKYDDYNWDWSLNYITNTCSKTRQLAMIASVPRVFHIGECGTHAYKNDCQESKIIATLKTIIQKTPLYPTTIRVSVSGFKKTNFVENGGWGDKRDQELCLNMTMT